MDTPGRESLPSSRSGEQQAEGPAPQVIPSDSALLRQSIERHHHYSETKSSGELVIRDQTGRAQLKKPMPGVRVTPSGMP